MSNYSPKISIILPSFNVVSYIRECLDSVINQTISDIEIICIDGGSTDGTFQILKEYENKDSRIKVFSSDVKSYGYQMNFALSVAKGEYVGIVETDDYIELNMYEELYKLSDGGKIDIVKGNFYHLNVSESGDVNLRIDQSKQDIPSRSFTIFEVPNILNGHPSIWAAIYNRKFLNENNIKFMEASGGGWVDNPFLFNSFLTSKSIRYNPTPFYYYRESNPDSSSNNLQDLTLPLERMLNNLDVFDEYGIIDENIIVALYVRIFWHVNDVLNNENLNSQKNIVYQYIKNIFERLDEKIIKKRLDISYIELYENFIYNFKKHSSYYKPKISIIMPFSNSEDLIEKSILSIINQNLEDIELLCINRGSSDSSEDILNKFLNQYHFIKMYEFDDVSISEALNHGIKLSNGEFITFLNVGEYLVDEDALERIYNYISSNNLNVGTGNLSPDENIYEVSNIANFKYFSEDSIINSQDYGVPLALNKNMFRKNFLVYNNIFFKNLIWGYDSIFLAEVLNKIDKIGAISTNIYPNVFHDKINYDLTLNELKDYFYHFKKVFYYLKDYKFRNIKKEYRKILFWYLMHLNPNSIDDAISILKNVFSDDIFLLADLENYFCLKFNDYCGNAFKCYSPLLSIIIPVDEISSNVKDIIQSIFNQSFTNFEVLLLTENPDLKSYLSSVYGSNNSIHILYDNYSDFEEMLYYGFTKSMGEWCLFFNPKQLISCNAIVKLLEDTLTQDNGLFMSKLKLINFYDNNALVRNLNSNRYNLNDIIESINLKKIKNPKISLIIPIYNAEPFLEEALDSVLTQTFNEIELVCVNDGSKDCSLDMLIGFANSDNRFFIIDQINAGCGAARNKAMDYASGDFIYFFDPDDYILPDTFERLYENAINNGTDLVMFKIARFVDQEPINYSAPGFDFENIFPNVDFDNFTFDYNDIRHYVMNASFAPWTKLYKKEFLDKYDDFRFPTNIAFDDAPFHIQSVLRASSISFIPEFFYYYRYNPNSIINTSSNGIDIFRICDIVENFLKNEGFYDDFRKEFDFFKITQIVNYLKSTKTEEYFQRAKSEFSDIKLSDDHIVDDYRLSQYNLVLDSDSFYDYIDKEFNSEISNLKNRNNNLLNNVNSLTTEVKNLNNQLTTLSNENKRISSRLEISNKKCIRLTEESHRLRVRLDNLLKFPNQNESNGFKKLINKFR